MSSTDPKKDENALKAEAEKNKADQKVEDSKKDDETPVKDDKEAKDSISSDAKEKKDDGKPKDGKDGEKGVKAEEGKKNDGEGSEDEKEDPPVKKMRTIESELSLPEDKDEQINYLLARLENAQGAIEDAQDALVDERQHRRNLQSQIEAKNKELTSLLDDDTDMNDKVQESMNATLIKASESKMKAEKTAKKINKALYERSMLIEELEYQIQWHKADIEFQKGQGSQDLDANYEALQKSLDEELQRNRQLLNENSENLQKLKIKSQEVTEARDVVFKLEDIRSVLQRILASDSVLTAGERHRYLKSGESADLNESTSGSQPIKTLDQIKAERKAAGVKGPSPIKSSGKGLNAVKPTGRHAAAANNNTSMAEDGDDFWFSDNPGSRRGTKGNSVNQGARARNREEEFENDLPPVLKNNPGKKYLKNGR